MQVQCQPAGWLVRYFGAVCEWTTVSVGKTVSKPNYVQHSVNGLSTTTLCLCGAMRRHSFRFDCAIRVQYM